MFSYFLLSIFLQMSEGDSLSKSSFKPTLSIEPIDIEFYCYAKDLSTAELICDMDSVRNKFRTDIFEDETTDVSSKKYSVYFIK